MRPEFFRCLYEQIEKNDNIYALTGDLGFGGFDKIMQDFPDRFINTGASEQCLLDMAVGLALEGKIPFVYSISPFLIFRAFETIRTYIDHEKVPVKLIGSGQTDKCYETEGFSHASWDIRAILEQFPNIKSYYPQDKIQISYLVKQIIDNEAPSVMLLKQK